MFVAGGAGYPVVAVLHLVAHAGFKALLVRAAGVAGEHAGSYALDRLQIGRALPVMTALAAIGTLALAGVPQLGGAWTKEAVIAAAGHEQKIVEIERAHVRSPVTSVHHVCSILREKQIINIKLITRT